MNDNPAPVFRTSERSTYAGDRPQPVQPATSVDGLQEPETLVIPAEAVAYLLNAAVQSQVGNAWWNGFVTAHGLPSWVVSGQWAFETQDVTVVKTKRQNGLIGK